MNVWAVLTIQIAQIILFKPFAGQMEHVEGLNVQMVMNVWAKTPILMYVELINFAINVY